MLLLTSRHCLPRSTTSWLWPANMPDNTHTTASGVCLRTVNMYLPQPVASCLRSPPAATQPPALVFVVFHPSAPSPLAFVHARWKCEYPLSLPAPFVEWHQSRLRASPDGRISSQLLEHAQIPPLRCVVQIRVPLAGAGGGATSPVTVDALHLAGWRPDLVLQMPRELYQPALAELPISLRQPQLAASGALAYPERLRHLCGLQVKSTCSTSSVLAASRLVPRRFLTSMP